MSTEKLNPQPEPPIEMGNILALLRYVFNWIWWIIWLPFSFIF